MCTNSVVTYNIPDLEWCAQQVQKQDATPMHVVYMVKALEYVRSCSTKRIELTEQLVYDINYIVLHGCLYSDPMEVFFYYRRHPVTIDNISLTDWRLIPNAMKQLCPFPQEHFKQYASKWVYWFLQAHPFSDGNGRTAVLIYNWMNGTLDNLVDLPEYSIP